MTVTRWKEADTKSKLSVFGYVRESDHEKDLRLQSIPLAIKCYCISYYFSNDYFTKHAEYIKINKFGNIAEGLSDLNRYRICRVYGNEVIDLTQIKNKDNKWKWTFKVSQTENDSFAFSIGINDSNKTILKEATRDQYKQFAHYSLKNTGERSGTNTAYCWEKGLFWGKEAIISMEIEYKSLIVYNQSTNKEEKKFGWHLLFSVNGKSQEERFIIKKSKYHLVVSISQKGQKIELLKYELSNK